MKRLVNKPNTATSNSNEKRKKRSSQDLATPTADGSNSSSSSVSSDVESEALENDKSQNAQKEEFNCILEPFLEPGLSERIEFRPDLSFEEMRKVMAKLFGLEVEMLEEEADVLINNQLKQKRKNRKSLTHQKKVYEKASTTNIPYLLFTCGFKEGILGLSGKEVVEKASTFIRDGTNPIYNSEKFRYVVNVTELKKGKPTLSTFYEKRGFPSSREFGTLEPVVVLDIDDENLEAKATSVTVCLIKNCHKKINMDAFTMEKLIKLYGDKTFTTLRQRPQPSTQNLRMDGTQQGFLAEDKVEERLLREVLKNHQEVYEVARKGFNDCKSSSPIQRFTILKMQKSLRDAQLECSAATGDEPYPIITFASNIDVDDVEEQMDALKLLPEFTLPNKRLAQILKDKLGGINQVQIYCKVPGCRTVAHYENQGIGSININIGPDDCVWFCISMKYAAELEKLLCRKRCAQYTSQIWPSEEELKKAGISYSKFLQKKGEMVFVNTGTYHWVQSNGFATNISWNVLLDDWTLMASAALSNDDTAAHRHHTVIPVEKLIWNIAKAKRNMGTEFSNIVKQMLTCSLARCKIEIDVVVKDGWEILDAAQCPAEVQFPSYCFNGCHRVWMFNLFFVKEIEVKKEGSEETERKLGSLCYQCVGNKEEAQCYRVHKLEELIKIYENYN
ncbi:hypothetical protein CAEBREN_14320 [Caenorhabditis brenneri]|uniref:JmjC domain-containing protein n=1 Tax=Caenorhabditis brenneri TaxID=135651 RepID=G0PCL9_CAEBE|nr:hypothetical protein CAEBREN_14320 [Caenorhabditis brenneri]